MPVKPTRFAVLAPGVVGDDQGAAKFVAGQQHRHALEQQHEKDILDLALVPS
jgi:hypothetical protein